MKPIDVYGIGAALLDTEIEITDDILKDLGVDKGVMTLVDEARQQSLIDGISNKAAITKLASGGSAANTIIAASQFGSKTHYSCKVANDDNGSLYLDDLKRAGVAFNATNAVSTDEGVTGKCLVFITPDAERTMNTYLGVSESLSKEQIDVTALKQSSWAYIEGYLVTSETGRPAAIELRTLAEQHNVKTAFSLSDPAMVQFFKDGLKDMIGSGVDLLFCNEAEALSYTDTQDTNAAVESLKAIAKTFAITLGAKGALVWDGNALITIAPHAVKAVDTNGAGDMFAGAFLYALSEGKSFEQAGNLASKAASVVVSQFGPRLSQQQQADILNEANTTP